VPKIQYFAAELQLYVIRVYQGSALRAYVTTIHLYCFYLARYNIHILKPRAIIFRLFGSCDTVSSATSSSNSVTSVATSESDLFTLQLLFLIEATLFLLLLVELNYFAKQTIETGTIIFAWLVWLFFCMFNLVHFFASSVSKYQTRFQMAINFAVFVSLCALGSDAQHLDSTTVTVVILMQTCRFVRVFDFLPRIDVFVSLLPIITRICVFYGMVLYSFSIVAHTSFCSVYRIDNVGGTDDDASSWLGFANLLNFDTFLSSFYTIAQMAVLSNWSIVMDAGVLCAPDKRLFTYMFFYTFRVLVVVVVLPLLMSCIIQTFIQNLSKPSETEMLITYFWGLNFVLSLE
jgi:hypothetical protein